MYFMLLVLQMGMFQNRWPRNKLLYFGDPEQLKFRDLLFWDIPKST